MYLILSGSSYQVKALFLGFSHLMLSMNPDKLSKVKLFGK